MTSCSSSSLQKPQDQSSKSGDTFCSSNSGCFLQRRKPVHPLAASLRGTFPHTTGKGSNVRQRVLSAKLLKLRNLQSQINDANYHLNELQRENYALKTLNRRQEKALMRYEGTNADLPRLLFCHGEEVRTLTEKNKSLRKTLKETTDLIKTRDDELLLVKKQIEQLEKLNKNKHLGERQKLSTEVEELKRKLVDAETQISVLNRKLLLEEKTSKQRISVENGKFKECQKSLAQALSEIDRLTGLAQVNSINNNKTGNKLLRKKTNSREHKSTVSLDDKIGIPLSETTSDESLLRELSNETNDSKLMSSNLQSKSANNSLLDNSDDIISPAKCVKAASSEKKTATLYSNKIEKSASPTEWERRRSSLRTSPVEKLESLSNQIDSVIRKSKENELNEFDSTLDDYCHKMLYSVKNCSKIVDNHQESLELSKNDTEILRGAVDEIKALDDELQRNNVFSIDATELKKLLKTDKTPNDKSKKNNKIKTDPKAKLLATLRAIDNGDSIGNGNTSTDSWEH